MSTDLVDDRFNITPARLRLVRSFENFEKPYTPFCFAHDARWGLATRGRVYNSDRVAFSIEILRFADGHGRPSEATLSDPLVLPTKPG